MNNDEPEIGGRLSKMKPRHFIFIGFAVIVFLLLLPTLISLIPRRSAPPPSGDSSGGLGTAWVQATPVVAKPTAPTALPMPAVSPSISSFSHSGQDPGLTAPMAMVHNTRISEPKFAAQAGNDDSRDTPLSNALKPTKLQGFRATRIRDPQWVVAQGTLIACTDITAINSTLPGFVTAILPYDVWSMDHTNILLNRGSRMFGEMAHGGLENGADRLFVLWRQITTPPPDNVRIELDSPAADELGRGGMDGDINRHLWRKIGATLLISAVQSGLQGASAGLTGMLSNGGSANSTNLNFYSLQGNGQGLANQYYASVANIPDVMTRLQGQPCSAMVAGDLDFSDVYKDVATR